jgi:hypothetical protein
LRAHLPRYQGDKQPCSYGHYAVMRGGMVHSNAMLAQVDVTFNPRVEPSFYESLNRKISWSDFLIKTGVHAHLRGHAHSRAIVVAHHTICQSSIMIAGADNDHVL